MFPPFFAKMAAEKGFDYGDIDDKHEYTSWYMKTFFSHYPNQEFLDGRTGKSLGKQLRHWVTPGRPMISQEFATGYPNADDGHTARKYIFDHMVPQAWIGDHAYEHNDPGYFLGSVAFNTKELAETLRCYYRDTMAGVLHFALNTWYQNIFEAERIRPYEVIPALAKGLQPVLVSARLYGRHFYAGDQPEVSLFVVNDDENGRDLKPTRLLWTVVHNKKVLTRGEQEIPAVPYYNNHEGILKLQLPTAFKSPRIDCQLVLSLQENGKTVSQNQYDLTLATREWVQPRQSVAPSVFDPGHSSEALWKALGVVPRWAAELPVSSDPALLVVNDYGWVQDAAKVQHLMAHVAAGGHVLLMNPNARLQTLLPDLVKSFRQVPSGEIATMRVPESPVFDGIEVMDIRWFNNNERSLPIVTRGDFRLVEDPRIEVLAKYTPTHAYLFKQELKDNIEGAVIFRIGHGRGQIWVTQLAHETGIHDPIAARLLSNLLLSATRTATLANK
jgi:hypothetical protein